LALEPAPDANSNQHAAIILCLRGEALTGLLQSEVQNGNPNEERAYTPIKGAILTRNIQGKMI